MWIKTGNTSTVNGLRNSIFKNSYFMRKLIIQNKAASSSEVAASTFNGPIASMQKANAPDKASLLSANFFENKIQFQIF